MTRKLKKHDANVADIPEPTIVIGSKMADGTVYAGVSPDSGRALYAMPADATLTMSFYKAKECASRLDAHGHSDWRMPTKNELNVLFNNRAAIGGFNVSGSDPAGWYWSSSQSNLWPARVQRFSDGLQLLNNVVNHSSVRYVR